MAIKKFLFLGDSGFATEQSSTDGLELNSLKVSGLNSAGVVHTNAQGEFSTSALVNSDVAADAAIAYSKLNLAGTILDSDVAANAAIVDTKLATISTAGKVSNSATTAASANTASAIVARDASGNFSAGTITAALSGNASTASAWQTSRTVTFATGDVTGSFSIDGAANVSNVDLTIEASAVTNSMLAGSIEDSKLNTISTAGKVSNSATTAASANTASAIVARDASGNFAAGTITAELSGNAATATKWATARDLSFTGDVTGTLSAVDGSAAVSASMTIGAAKVTNSMLAGSISEDKLAGSIPDSKLNTISTAGKVADSALSANIAKLDGGQTFSAHISVPNSPSASGHAANKKYVDDQLASATAGLDYKQEVQWYWDLSTNDDRLGDPGNAPPVPSTKAGFVDGINAFGASFFTAGDRILLNDSSAANTDAGIWVFSGTAESYTLARATDMASGNVTGAWVYALKALGQNGPEDHNTAYVCNSTGSVGSAIQFMIYSRAEQVTASGVLAKTGLNIALNIGAGLQNSSGYLSAKLGDGLKIDEQDSDKIALRRATYSGLAINSGQVSVDAAYGLEVASSGASQGKVVAKFASNPGLEVENVSQGLRIKASSGVELDANGLKAKVASGLHLDADYIKAKLAATGAISVDGSDALKVNAGDGLQVNGSNELYVAVGNGIQISSDAVAAKLETNKALSIGANGGLQVVNNANKGVAISASGLEVDLDGVPGLEFSSGKLRVKVGDALALNGANGKLDVKTGEGMKVDLDGGGASVLMVRRASTGALQINNSLEMYVDTDESSIIHDANNNHRLKIGTLPLGFKVDSVATANSVTAANLTTLTAGSAIDSDGDASSLHRHDALRMQIDRASSLTAGDVVTVNSNGLLAKADKSDGKVVGIAVADNGGESVLAFAGVATIVAPAGIANGDTLYLGAAGAIVSSYSSFSSGDKIVKLGRYIGNNKMAIAIQDIGQKA